jgi:hypothetical protein
MLFGATDISIPVEKLRELSRIYDKAMQAAADPDFLAKIRERIPVLH